MEAVTPGGTEGATTRTHEETVEKTLEGLLSKKNLVRDQFLAGNMNPQMYIPIRVLVAHEKLTALGVTEEALIIAATNSTRLGIDDAKTMVRPLLKSKRNVIILRDVAENSTEEEIRGIFAGAPHAEKMKTVKEEVNNAWFVKFDLDEGTQDVVLWLRSQCFKGQPISASIKSEHFLRSFYPLHPPGAESAPQHPWMAQGGNPVFYPPVPDQFGGPPQLSPATEGLNFSGGMPFMPPMPPMPPSRGGFWQPWGKKRQPPPIILPTTTPATASAAEVYTVGESRPADNERSWKTESWQGGAGWQSWQDRNEKGWQSWQDGGTNKGWPSWQDGGKSKGGWPSWQDGGKSKGGKGKPWEDKGGKGKGKDSKGWGNDSKGWGKDGKGFKAEADAGEDRKGKSGRGERPGEQRSDANKKWKVRGDLLAKGSDEQAAAPAGPPPPLPLSTYTGEYRKYGREKFEELCNKGLSLSKPDCLEQLGDDAAIFRETPSADLAPPLAEIATES